MKNQIKLLATATVSATASILLSSQAAAQATYYWDNNDTTAGFGTAGGTWTDPTASQWSTDETGVTAPEASITTTTSDTLYFGTNAVGLASGTINVDGTVDASQILFGKASGAITLSGGTINLVDGQISAASGGGTAAATHTIDSNITQSTGTLQIGTQSTLDENYIVNGNLSGDFNLDIRVRNNSAYVELNGLNTFTGNVSIVTGQLNVNSIADAGLSSALGAGSTITMAGNGGQAPTLWYTGTTAASTDRTFNLRGGSSGVDIVSQDAALTLTGALTSTATGTEPTTTNLRLSGDAGGGSNFNEISGDITGNVELSVTNFTPEGPGTHAEAGIWKLSGTNTYTGTTTVSAGTLIIDGDQSGATGDVTVESGATLAGSGTIGGATTIEVGAFLNPGNSPGLMTFVDDLTLTGTTTMEIAGSVRGTGYDGFDVGGLLTYGGALLITSDTIIANGTYDLFGINGTEGGDFSSVTLSGTAYGTESLTFDSSDMWTTTLAGITYTFSQSTGEFSVVPESSTYALLAGLTGLAFVMVRRRRA